MYTHKARCPPPKMEGYGKPNCKDTHPSVLLRSYYTLRKKSCQQMSKFLLLGHSQAAGGIKGQSGVYQKLYYFFIIGTHRGYPYAVLTLYLAFIYHLEDGTTSRYGTTMTLTYILPPCRLTNRTYSRSTSSCKVIRT